MKKVVIEVPNDKSEKILAKFKDTLYSVNEGEKSTRFTLYVPDEMLDELIHKTNEQSVSYPVWSGIFPDYESSGKEDDRISLVEVSTPDFVISPFVEKLREQFKNTGNKKHITPIEKIIASTESYTKFDQKKFILAAIPRISGDGWFICK